MTASRPRNFEDILSKLPDARQSGDKWTAACPLPGHKTPAGHLTLKDAGDKALVTCQRGRHNFRDKRDYQVICQAWGFDSLTYARDGGPKAPARRATVTRFEIRNPEGQVVAVHVRRDRPEGKTLAWERPGGELGLGGLPVADLPLYGVEHLQGLPQGATLVVTEGEKCADSLRKLGIPAVGTVTGAGATPGLEALRPLASFDVVLWPDNDDSGRAHMARIAARLLELKVKPRMVAWPEAPPKGDAADAIAQGVDVAMLLQQAQEWEPLTVEDLAALLADVEDFIGKYVATGGAERTALALWVAHTHAFEAAECTPYLHITSAEKQSGKTRLLETLALLVARPWVTSRVSAAVLVRKVARDAPSLLLDETDSAFKAEAEYAEALRGILNAGYRRGGMASLCVKKGADFDLADFSTFCPKALAGIGQLPDTVADRSIRLNLKRRSPWEEVARFRLRDAQAQAGPLRERLERWANVAVTKLAQARPMLPEQLSDRAADVWEPLFAISDMAGGEWPRQSRQAALVLAGHDVDDGLSLGAQLLRDIALVLDGREGPIPSSELAKALVELEESPWGDLHGRPLDTRKLARLLKPYGLKPKGIRVGDTTPRGYHPDDFTDAFSRYLRSPEISATSATSATKSTSKSEKLALGPENVADVADVAVKRGIHGEDDTPPPGGTEIPTRAAGWEEEV